MSNDQDDASGSNGEPRSNDLFWAERDAPAPADPPPGAETTTTDAEPAVGRPDADTAPAPSAGTLGGPAETRSPGLPSWLPGYAVAATVVALILLIGFIVVLAADKKDHGPNDKVADGGAKTTEPTDEKPVKKGWPDSVSGRPDHFGARHAKPPTDTVDAEPGAYLWNDFDGWHLWIVRGGGIENVKGQIVLNADATRATPATPGQGTVTAKAGTISFDFSGQTAPVVGVEFNTFYGSRVEATVEADGRPLETSQIHTGRKGAPSTNPISVTKLGS